MNSIKLTSCMAENMAEHCRQLATYLNDRLDIAVELVEDIPWQERQTRLDIGTIQVGWICGLPYAWRADRGDPIELLAAPVMQGDRYQNQPVYFSDLVVRRDSPFHSLEDLRGARWAYNESRSHSGCYLTRYELAQRGKGSGYFGIAIGSGSHQASLQMILEQSIDASAIDSTVLALELQRQPELGDRIRIIDWFGPSPIPPWIISTQVPPSLRDSLRAALLTMHTDPAGQAVLAAGLIDRFVAVRDADYDQIRTMAQLAETVQL